MLCLLWDTLAWACDSSSGGKASSNSVNHGSEDAGSGLGGLGGSRGVQEGGYITPMPGREVAVEILQAPEEAGMQKHGPLERQAEAHPPLPK